LYHNYNSVLFQHKNYNSMFNKMIAGILPYFPKKFVWLFSKRYIAGVSLTDAHKVCRQLSENKMIFTLDMLGEFITDLSEAEENKQAYLKIIEQTETIGLEGNYSLKPTMFGLLLDKNICFNHIRDIVAKAASYNNFVRIDMEDSQCVDMEVDIYRRLKKEFPKNVGLVVQAYLKRTLTDLKNMLDMHSTEAPLNFRLCKGIYVESPSIAYKKYEEINAHYLEDLECMFQNKIYVGIATHDKNLVEAAYKLIEKHKVAKNMYEFQMLYGVTPELRDSIVKKGHKLRVYVPYGEKWFGYSTRRLKENPQMAGEVMLNDLMGKLQEAQQQMVESKKRLNSVFVEAEVENGLVKVKANGNRKITQLSINKELLQNGDIEEIEDLIITAVNKAIEKADKLNEGEMSGMAANMMPNLANLFGG